MDQKRAFYDVVRRLGEQDRVFLHLAETLTRDELQRLIKKRPELWGRYRTWLLRLPE